MAALRIGFGEDGPDGAGGAKKALERVFSPEFRNRLDATIFFRAIGRDVVRRDYFLDEIDTPTRDGAPRGAAGRGVAVPPGPHAEPRDGHAARIDVGRVGARHLDIRDEAISQSIELFATEVMPALRSETGRRVAY
jgi:hypothetical protein